LIKSLRILQKCLVIYGRHQKDLGMFWNVCEEVQKKIGSWEGSRREGLEGHHGPHLRRRIEGGESPSRLRLPLVSLGREEYGWTLNPPKLFGRLWTPPLTWSTLYRRTDKGEGATQLGRTPLFLTLDAALILPSTSTVQEPPPCHPHYSALVVIFAPTSSTLRGCATWFSPSSKSKLAVITEVFLDLHWHIPTLIVCLITLRHSVDDLVCVDTMEVLQMR
jgi:hypothetical protein